MTERRVVDYSFDRPDLAALRAAGYIGVIRYLAYLPNEKVITAEEAAAILAAFLPTTPGAGLGFVWETTADRATAGFAAGVDDANAAFAMVDELGLPACSLHPGGCPVYFAVDAALPYDSVASYFAGAMSVNRARTGAYGSYRICVGAQAAGVPFLWQTVAWSDGALLASAHLYQRNFHSVDVPGAWDENVILQDDWGQWSATSVPPQPPKEPDVSKVAYPLAVQSGESRTLPVLAIGGGFGWTRASVTFGSQGVDVVKAIVGPNERPIPGLAPEGVETAHHFGGRGYIDLQPGDEWIVVDLAPSPVGTLDLYVEASDA